MSPTTLSANETNLAELQAQGAELIARDRWPRDQLLRFQRERLRELLAFATSSSPYYREALGPDAAGGEMALDELPTLSKTTLIDQFDRIVTDPRLRLAELEEHLQGPDQGVLYLDRYRVFSTSGTSGVRALVVYSEEEFRFWVAVSLRLFSRMGITPGTRVVAIGAPNPLHITRELFASFRTGRAGSPELSVLTPLDELVSALNDYRPEVLIGYASIAALLAREQLEGRLRIAPRIVAVGSEVLTDEARRWIREAWETDPTDVYATTETLYVASSTPPHDGLHINEDLAVVEVVDEHNRPVPPGQPGYKVLVTNLVNRTQPLIRYEISDSVTLADGDGSANLPYQRLASVDGRSDDILEFPGPSGGRVCVHPYRLRAPFANLADVRQYQLVRTPGGLQVRVVPQPDAAHDTLDRVGAALAKTLAEAGAAPVPVEVVRVEAIERESGHAAKLKLVKDLTRNARAG
jgi:putative adenylate-forming enzyme